MADLTTLINGLKDVIKTNSQQSITGDVLQGQLLAIINSLNTVKADQATTYTKSQTYTRAEVNSRIEYSATMNKGKIFKDLGQRSDSFAEVVADVTDGAYTYYDTNSAIYIYFIKTEPTDGQYSCLYTSSDEWGVWYIANIDGDDVDLKTVITNDDLATALTPYAKSNTVVKLTGNQNISGSKYFTNILVDILGVNGEHGGKITITEDDPFTDRNSQLILRGAEGDASILVERDPVVDLEVATKQYVDGVASKVGDLSSLATTDKTSIVNAVNELRNNIISTLNTAV